MGLSPQLITEKLYKRAVQRLQHLSKDNREAIRLRAIVAAKEHGMTIVAKIFNVNSNTIRSWAKRFESGDVSNLAYQAGRGRKPKLADEHLAAINTWAQDDSSITMRPLKDRFLEIFFSNLKNFDILAQKIARKIIGPYAFKASSVKNIVNFSFLLHQSAAIPYFKQQELLSALN